MKFSDIETISQGVSDYLSDNKNRRYDRNTASDV